MSEANVEENVNAPRLKPEGPWKIAWNRFKKNKIAVVGGVSFVLIVLAVIIVPMIYTFNLWSGMEGVSTGEVIRETVFVDLRAHGFELSNAEAPPSSENLLGTDRQGRDVMFRLFYGGRISMMVGILSAFLTVTLGTLVGGVAGYYGGKIDGFLMRFAEIVQSIPFLPMMMVISAAMRWVPSDQTMLVVVFVVGILSWPGLSRVVRGQILSLREQEFMQATEILGISDTSRIVRHLLPNVLAYIIVSATLGMGGAILLEAGLSFLGLGVSPPMPSWGNMIQTARNSTVFQNYPWIWVPPGLMIMLTVISVNLLGEGLRDAFDPKEIR